MSAAPIKILVDSRHAYTSVTSTINQLMGTGHIGTDFIVHSTNMVGAFSTNVADAINTTTQRYNESGVLVPSQGPYQIFTSSCTNYSGDSITEYNYSNTYDLTHNYAYSSDLPAGSPPPAFHFAPGHDGHYGTGPGLEWVLDPIIFPNTYLSGATGDNAGVIAVLHFLHPTWNMFDVKAALRQTGSNWNTGFDNATFGFGQVDYEVANAFTDNELLLQPPSVKAAVTGGKITFTLFPFKQTRRVKEVLFQFAAAPTFQANELTLAEIEALGGTKITESTSVSAQTLTPIYTAETDAYFVWFTTDNTDDNTASFSRIDTYSILGPLSQDKISFTSAFNIVSPTNNAVSASQFPSFVWQEAESHFGIAKYQLFIDGVLNKDDITGTSATPTGELSPGTHTWYIKVFNDDGDTISSTSTFTLNVIPGYTSNYTFYVDNVLGDDNGVGSASLPWASLTKAGEVAQAGDTVVIIKNENVPYREELYLNTPGTSSDRITFRGIDSTHKPEIWGSEDVSGGWTAYGGGNANTYQKTLTTQSYILATGFSVASLENKTKGSSSDTLGEGECGHLMFCIIE